MQRESFESVGHDIATLSDLDAQLIKLALAAAAGNGCLPPPHPVTGEGEADLELVRRLARAFNEIDRLAACR